MDPDSPQRRMDYRAAAMPAWSRSVVRPRDAKRKTQNTKRIASLSNALFAVQTRSSRFKRAPCVSPCS
jgi:hypothetical protein